MSHTLQPRSALTHAAAPAAAYFCQVLQHILFSPSLMQSMIELSRTQDEEVGDGTTSVIILGNQAPAHALSSQNFLHTQILHLGWGHAAIMSQAD